MFLPFFETTPRDERTSILTIFNLANAVALVIGALIGGGLLKLLGASREAYLVLFAVSSFARAGTLVFLKFSPVAAPVESLPAAARLQPATVPTPVASTVSAPSK